MSKHWTGIKKRTQLEVHSRTWSSKNSHLCKFWVGPNRCKGGSVGVVCAGSPKKVSLKRSAISAFMFSHLIFQSGNNRQQHQQCSQKGRKFPRLSGGCVHLYHSTAALSTSTRLSLWCGWVEAAHPGSFPLFSIYSNITDNDPTYKTISTPARRTTWIKDALRPIFFYPHNISFAGWKGGRSIPPPPPSIPAGASRDFSPHCLHISDCCGRKSAGSELLTTAAFSPLRPVYAREVISVFQQGENGINRMCKNA